MKRALLLTAAAAMTLVSTVAQAQSYRGYDRNDRREYRQERREDRREYRQDRREDRREYRQDRRDDRRYYSQWRRGQVFAPQYRQPRYVFNDYGRYRLAAPPRGYQYYRSGNDVLLIALATGVIGAVFGGLLNSGPQYVEQYPSYGYQPAPVYQQPYPAYQQPYSGYEQPYYAPRYDRN